MGFAAVARVTEDRWIACGVRDTIGTVHSSARSAPSILIRASDDATIIATFTSFAELIAFHLEAHKRLNASQDALATERRIAVLREQFIATVSSKPP